MATLQSISLSFDEVYLGIGESKQLDTRATAKYSDGSTKAVTITIWDVQDQDVASITSKGVITGLTEGQSMASAGYTEGGVTVYKVFNVDVSNTSMSIEVSPSTTTIGYQGGNVSYTVSYYGFPSTSYIGQPYIPSGLSIAVGSTRTYSDRYERDYTVTVPENTSLSVKTYNIKFQDRESSVYKIATITQTAGSSITVSPPVISAPKGGSSYTVTVDYNNFTTSEISTPSVSQAWLTYTRTSRTTTSTGVREVYKVTVPTNSGYTRTSALTFKAAHPGSTAIVSSVVVTQAANTVVVIRSNNPWNVSWGPGTQTATNVVEYRGTYASDRIGTPSVTGDWITLSAGSIELSDSIEGYIQPVTASVAANLTIYPRSGSITFKHLDAIPTESRWEIYQKGTTLISASTRTVNFGWGSDSTTISVDYINIPSADIKAPSSNQAWCSVVEGSRTALSDRVRVTYTVSVQSNSGPGRGATLSFTATGASSENITVAQAEKRWVEFDSTTPSSVTVSAYPGTDYTTVVWYRNTTANSGYIQSPVASNWITLVSSSSYYDASLGTKVTYTWRIADNANYDTRTGGVTFKVTGGSPESTYWSVTQIGRQEVVVPSSYRTLNHDYTSGTWNYYVDYYNVAYGDIATPTHPSWITVTETSHTTYSTYVRVYYTVTISSNGGWERTGQIQYYAPGITPGITTINQGTHKYTNLISGNNPVQVSSTPGISGELPVKCRIKYYHLANASSITTPVSSSNWFRISDLSSPVTVSDGIYQDVSVTVDNNFSTSSRSGNITFTFNGSENSYVWNINQAGDKVITPSTDTVSFTYSGGTKSLTVDYINIDGSAIKSPEITDMTGNWATVTETSRSTSGNKITVTYKVTASENTGWNRGATVKFSSTISSVSAKYISIAQGQRTYVHLDGNLSVKNTTVPAIDPYAGNNPTYYNTEVYYYHTVSGSANIKAPVSSSNWLSLSYSGSIKTNSEAYIDVWKLRVLDNTSWDSRTGSITFGLTGGDPGTATWNITQKGYPEVVIQSGYTSVTSTHSSKTWNYYVDYYNIPYSTIASPVHPSWITVKETSHTVVSQNQVRVYYTVTIPTNTGWERTGKIQYYAPGIDPGITTVSQGTRKYTNLIAGSNPVNVSDTPGLSGELPVSGTIQYYHISDTSLVNSPVSSSDWFRVNKLGNITSNGDGLYQNVELYVNNNLTYYPRTGSVTFGFNGSENSYDWVIQQKATTGIVASNRDVKFEYTPGSNTINVTYYNIGSSHIKAPSIETAGVNWLTVVETSRSASSDISIVVTYKLTVTENTGPGRGATVKFSSDLPGVVSEYISVGQSFRTWIEIDGSGQSKITTVPAKDPYPGEEPTYYSSNIFYYNTDSGSSTIKTPTSSSDWIVLDYSGSIKTYDRAYIDVWTVRVLDNTVSIPRTGSVTFELEGGNPGTATWTFRQAPALSINSYPMYITASGERILYTSASSYPVRVYWRGASNNTIMRSSSYGGNWGRMTEYSRSLISDESGSAIITYYNTELDKNTGNQRQMGMLFTAEDQEARIVIVQTADYKTSIVGPSLPITSSAGGGSFGISVWYSYVTSTNNIKVPTISGNFGTVVLDHFTVEDDGILGEYTLNIPANTSEYKRSGTVSFGISGLGVSENANLDFYQLGVVKLTTDPKTLVLPSRENVAVVGTTYFNLTSASVQTPVSTSNRIGIESKTGFQADTNYVELYTIRIPANTSGQRFTGSITFSATTGSSNYSSSVSFIQGAYPYIETMPLSASVTASGIKGMAITASYFNILASEIDVPTYSSADVSGRLLGSSVSTGSLDEEVNIEQYYLVDVKANTGSSTKEHTITFSAGNEYYDFNITQYAKEAIIVEPTSSIFPRIGGSQEVLVTYLGVDDDRRIDRPTITGNWITASILDHRTENGNSYELWKISAPSNNTSYIRSGNVIFSTNQESVTGSFSLSQNGPEGIVVTPSSSSVDKSGGTLTVSVLYRNYREDTIPTPQYPIQVSVVESSRSQSGSDLTVRYAVEVSANDSFARTLGVIFSYGDNEAIYAINQEGSQVGDKVQILSSNPLPVPHTSSTQTILVQYATSVQNNIQTPEFGTGVTLTDTTVISSTGGYTVQYTVLITDNPSDNRRTMTGTFSLLEGGTTYSSILNINQASSQAISLDYSTAPAWIENYLTIQNTESTTLQVTIPGSGTVYNKTLYRAPNSSDIKVDVNRILESYVGASDLPTTGVNKDVTRSALSATLSTSQDSAQAVVLNDWSYVLRDNYSILSNPINTTVAYGQYFPISLFCPTGTAVSVRYTKPDGSSHTISTGAVKGQILDGMIRIDERGTWNINGINYTVVECNYVLYYYNKRGGWDSLPVTGVILPSHDYERSTIGPRRLVTRDYSVIGSKKYELHTGILLDEQAKEIDNLIGSVKLYLQDVSTTTLVPVRVVDGSTQVKSYKNQSRQFPMYTFNVQEIESKKRK